MSLYVRVCNIYISDLFYILLFESKVIFAFKIIDSFIKFNATHFPNSGQPRMVAPNNRKSQI